MSRVYTSLPVCSILLLALGTFGGCGTAAPASTEDREMGKDAPWPNLSRAAGAATIYVDDDASLGGDGTS